MLSPKAKRNLFRITPFGFIWLIFGLCYLILEKGFLGDLDYYPSTGNPYTFGINILTTLIFVLIFGLLIGSFEILYLNNQFTKRSFSKKIFFKSIIYIFLIFVFLVVLTLISNSIELHTGIFDKEVLSNLWKFIISFSFWGIVLYIALVIGVALFFSEVSENIGSKVLHNFFIGKYHNPIEEERIFMFLDMKSSTTIAENLGHVRYFEMLKEYYSDFTEPIIKYDGEIYNYVGDEIILSWQLKVGGDPNNCLNCFFAMKDALENDAKSYQSKYGVMPGFKAGVHVGTVTAGEIGVIKKDIIFTGDVLNTTARIQGLCNTYDVDILISGQLKDKLNHEAMYEIQSLGSSELRGRKEKVELFTVNLK